MQRPRIHRQNKICRGHKKRHNYIYVWKNPRSTGVIHGHKRQRICPLQASYRGSAERMTKTLHKSTTIREIRSGTGLSQTKFCEPLNIPTRTLQKWETGERKCPDYVVELIAYRVQHDPIFRAKK